MKRRRRHGGRPRSLTAKRRATTTAGREPAPDYGTVELRSHRVAATTTDALPNDILGAMQGHALITPTQYRTAIEFADLVTTMRRGFGLTEASAAGAWRNILSAAHVSGLVSIAGTPAADRARRALARFHRDLGEGPWRAICDATDNVWWGTDLDRFLAELTVALAYLEPRLPLIRRGSA